MSPLKRSNNIAARMGRWSASHWKTAVFGWLAFVVVAVAIGMVVGPEERSTRTTRTSASRTRRPDPQRRRLPGRPADRDRRSSRARRSPSRIPAFKAAVDDVVGAVTPFATIKNLRSPLDPAMATRSRPTATPRSSSGT